jgi:hypothetical protein
MPGPTFFELARSIDNELKGNFRWPKKSVVAAGVTVLSGNFDAQVECDASTGAQNIQLPDATKNPGMPFFIKKRDASANPVLVSCVVGGQLIDGAASFSLSTQNDFLIVFSNGTGYSIYSRLVTPVGPGAVVYNIKKVYKTDGVSTLNPVDGTTISFDVAVDGECYFSATGIFGGFSGLIFADLAIYVDGVLLVHSDYFTVNGSGGDSTGPVTQEPAGSIFLAAGTHTVQLVAGQINLGLQASATDPLTLTVIYPSAVTTGTTLAPEAARVRTSVSKDLNPALVVPFDVIVASEGNLFDILSPTRMTAQKGGWYLFEAQLLTDAGMDGSFRSLKLRKNGADVVAWDQRDDFVHNATQRSLRAQSGPILLSAGDYVEVVGETDATDTGRNALAASDYSIVFSGVRLIPGSTISDISARVSRAVDQTIPDSTPDSLSWDTVIYDTANFFTALQPTRLTVPVSGKYDITLAILWDATTNPAGLFAAIQLNGGASIAVDQRPAITQNGGYPTTLLCVAQGVPLAAGDYVEATVFQDSGAGLNVVSDGGLYFPVFAIKKVN